MERHTITQTLNDYASVLNNAQVDLISSFYTADGRFMPEGMKTLLQPGQLKRAGENQLAKNQFHIQYTVTNTSGNDLYAFVEAVAQTKRFDKTTEKMKHYSSRDFFVLKKEANTWKIYRYMFNNVEENL